MAPKARIDKSKAKKTGSAKKKNRRAKPRAGAGNVDKLVKAGVLDVGNLSAKHRKIIDTKLSAVEIKALIKAKKLLAPKGEGPWQPDADGASF